MLTPRLQIGIIAFLLILAGISIAAYKSTVLGFPLLPGQQRAVWTIESKISFKPGTGAVEVDLRLPQGQAGWAILDEYFASSGFGFGIVEEDGARRAKWTKQSLANPTTLYYKLQTHQARSTVLEKLTPPVEVLPPHLSVDRKSAVERVVEDLHGTSADAASFAALLLQQLNQQTMNQDSLFLFGDHRGNELQVVLEILSFAGIPAQRIRGIFLEDGRKRQHLAELLEVYSQGRWQVFDTRNAQQGLPEDFFIWQRGGQGIVDVIGGQGSTIEFALVKNTLPVRSVLALERLADSQAILNFSIYSLPVEQQGMFKGILLIPVGALVVVLLRILVGIRTSGTFMPILIALAFIQTTLVTGLVIFLTIVGTGLWIRNYLSHLNLLLVARITAVVVVVIALMATLSVVSYKLGYEQALTVTFFPTIILAWTVERMSVLWEEEGGGEVLIQGGGSLFAAVLAYLLMSNTLVGHLTFNFPELLLCLLGAVLLLGKYTGYRLMELYRFRQMEGNGE